jgi:hypothetical protein
MELHAHEENGAFLSQLLAGLGNAAAILGASVVARLISAFRRPYELQSCDGFRGEHARDGQVAQSVCFRIGLAVAVGEHPRNQPLASGGTNTAAAFA